MKKTYTKPTIEFVDFTLSSSIADDCNLQANHDQGVCSPVINDNGYTIYNQAYNCDYKEDQEIDVCYHVPILDLNIFSS